MRVAWLVVLACGMSVAAAAACSSSGDGGASSSSSGGTSKDGGSSGAPKDADVGDGGVGNVTDLTVLPDRAYTGFDGTHAYQLPVSVAGSASDLTLTASDPSAVDIKPAVNTNPEADPSEKWFLVTTKKAGSVTLTARSGGKTAESKLTITAYSTARWDTGNQRYHNGEGGDPPCAQCHEKAGGPDHSPLTLSPVDDESAKTVITAGIVNNIPIKGVNHKWQATPAELDGLVTYLRALPPRGIQASTK